MASSMTMTASFLGGAFAAKPAAATTRRGSLAVRASMDSEAKAEERSDTRRGLVLAVVAAAASSVAKVAMADEEPKRGSLEAKKKYAPICVTMPTARICRN
ncbi:photosystem II 5 kDa protein, chloroplastic-like [Salvia splendens]|nr:photosystem II 5 kDa protein, chloroplastic-like [Salvia splendens]